MNSKPPVCVGRRDDATILSIRDGRWRQQIGYYLKLKPARKADMKGVLSYETEACWEDGWRT